MEITNAQIVKLISLLINSTQVTELLPEDFISNFDNICSEVAQYNHIDQLIWIDKTQAPEIKLNFNRPTIVNGEKTVKTVPVEFDVTKVDIMQQLEDMPVIVNQNQLQEIQQIS